MNPAKITATVSTLFALAGFAAAGYEYRLAQHTEQALAEAERPHLGGVAPAGARDRALRRPTDSGGTPPPQAERAPPPAGRPASAFSALLALLDNPAMQKQNAIMAKVRLDGQYAALFKSLGLAPDQVDQFKDLLVEKAMVGFDSMSAANQQGIDAKSNPRAFFQAVAARRKDGRYPDFRPARVRRLRPIPAVSGDGPGAQYEQPPQPVPELHGDALDGDPGRRRDSNPHPVRHAAPAARQSLRGPERRPGASRS